MEIREITHDTVLSMLPNRKHNTHKASYGRLLLLCGSRGYTGAAALAAMGALRAGAGLVYLGVPESIYQIEAIKLLEPVVFPLADRGGMLASEAIEDIAPRISKIDAVLIGPGLGCSDGTQEVVRWVLNNFTGPVVLDADGINVMQMHKDVLRERTSTTILTPHEGEFTRIGGDLSHGRVEGAIELAKDLRIIVALKGHNTVITDGTVTYVNTTGNPGMAVGGSGDILAGIITGLLGQGIKPLEATACGVWLHGAAGDLCAKEIGQYGMLPSDMLNVLPRLMK